MLISIVKTSVLSSILILIGLTGCGNSSSSNNDTTLKSQRSIHSGIAIDGILSGSTVCMDVNKNNKCDAGEPSAITDENGKFTLPETTLEGSLLLVGGIDKSTNKPFIGTLKAPKGSSVVTPLTSAIEVLVESGKSVKDAESTVKAAMGLNDVNVSLTSFDPYNGIKTDPKNAKKILAKQTQLQVLVHTASVTIAGADGNTTTKDTMGTVFSTIVEDFTLNKKVILDANAVTSIIRKAAKKTYVDKVNKNELIVAVGSVADIKGTNAAKNADFAEKSILNSNTSNTILVLDTAIKKVNQENGESTQKALLEQQHLSDTQRLAIIKARDEKEAISKAAALQKEKALAAKLAAEKALQDAKTQAEIDAANKLKEAAVKEEDLAAQKAKEEAEAAIRMANEEAAINAQKAAEAKKVAQEAARKAQEVLNAIQAEKDKKAAAEKAAAEKAAAEKAAAEKAAAEKAAAEKAAAEKAAAEKAAAEKAAAEKAAAEKAAAEKAAAEKAAAEKADLLLKKAQPLLDALTNQNIDTTGYSIVDANATIKVNTLFLGKKVDITAFYVGTSGDYAIVAEINSPLYDVVNIQNDNWLYDPTNIDRSSSTRKLYLDDMGFSTLKTFVYTSSNLTLNETNTPQNIKNILQSIDGDKFNVVFNQGLSLHNKLDLNKIPEIADTLKFLINTRDLAGIKNPSFTYNAKIPVNILLDNQASSLAEKVIVPKFELHTAIDPFDLQFGDFVNFTKLGLLDPLAVQPVLHIQRDSDRLNVTIVDSSVEMPIVVNATLDSNFEIYLKTSQIEKREQRVSINVTNNKEWPIFGARWLMFAPKSYGMHFKIPALDAALTIKYLAQTKLLDKYVTYQTESTLIAGLNASKILPPSQGFILHDGYGKVGEVPVNWTAQLFEYMLKTAGANIDFNLATNIISPLKLFGVVPDGGTLENYEKQLGHPVGVNFEIYPSPTGGVPGVNFSGGLKLFDIKKPLATVEKFTVSAAKGVRVKADTTDFTIGDGSLFTMPNFAVEVNIPGLLDIAGDVAKAPLNTDYTFGRNVITAVESSASVLAGLYNEVEVKLIGKAKVLTSDATLTYIVTPYTQRSEFEMYFAGIKSNTKLFFSGAPWDPAMDYEMNLDTNQLSNWSNAGSAAVIQGINDTFANINAGLEDLNKPVEKAQADLDKAKSDRDRIIAQAKINKARVEKPIRDAKDKVNAAKDNLSRYDHNMYYRHSSSWSNCKDIWLVGRVCTKPPGRWAAYVPWQAGRGIYLTALSAAETILTLTERTINVVPIDAYPEVIAAKANVTLAEQNLAAANDLANSLKAVSSAIQTAITTATDSITNSFQLKSFKIYGGYGLNSRVGIAAKLELFGKIYEFNEGVNGDLTYLRDNFVSILNEKIWKPFGDMVANDGISKEAPAVFAQNNIVNAAPTGTVPAITLLQDNSKQCKTGVMCYSADIASYISDSDTNASKLNFTAIGLPKHLRMDRHGMISGGLDRSDIGEYNVNVTVMDNTFQSLNTSFKLNITGKNSQHDIKVVTVNQSFDSQSFDINNSDALVSTYASIRADAKADSYGELARVVVDDPDIGDTYKYEIISGNEAGDFSIDSKGVISMNQQAEGNIKANYSLKIAVTDNSQFSPTNLSAETTFNIDVAPIIWVEKQDIVNAEESPSFKIHVSPKPSKGNSGKFVISYDVIADKQATDDSDQEGIVNHTITIQGNYQGLEDRYVWNDSVNGTYDEANSNRQIDRKYTIKLAQVTGKAYIDPTRDTLESTVYAFNRSPKVAPLSTNNTTYTKLDINGSVLDDSATDWACVRDNVTGLMWASRSRIKEHLASGDYHPYGWDGTQYSDTYGLNLIAASFGQHGVDERSRLLNNFVYGGKGYCGSQDVNVPTVKELQSLVDYNKADRMVNEEYFPNMDFTQPYLALNVDRLNVDATPFVIYNGTGYIGNNLNFSVWLRNDAFIITQTREWVDKTGYLYNLGNNNSGLLDLPLSDTPQDVNVTLARAEEQLSAMLSTIDFNSGTVSKAKTNYVYNASYKAHYMTDLTSQVAPYFKGKIMYVIYPRAGNALFDANLGDGQKDEDLSYIIQNYFSADIFIHLR